MLTGTAAAVEPGSSDGESVGSATMRIGIFGGAVAGSGTVNDIVQAAATAQAEGFPSFWLPQIFAHDAITVAGVIGREVPGIELGTAVVPTYPRHPMMLAQQALTTNELTGGRFTLGIGLSHQPVIEQMMGMSFEKPVRHMREYLSILRPLLHERTVAFNGETLGANATIEIPAAEPTPILVAALGPRMLALAGELADGTITWMTGPETVRNHIVPSIRAGAEGADRPTPRVVTGVPICVTDDPDAVRARAAKALVVYGVLPSYRAMLDREGLEGPADIVIAGSEDECRAGIERYVEAGADDVLAMEMATGDDRDRTRAFLRTLL
jgi:5,10-methylenetetrahydromethanopterin reductase